MEVDTVTKVVSKALNNWRPAGGYFGTRKYKVPTTLTQSRFIRG